MIVNERRVIVVGLGNTLLTDDGVGVYAVRRVRSLLEPDEPIATEEAEIAGFALLDLLAGYDRAIVIDAVSLPGRAAGDHFAPLGRRAEVHANAVPNLWGPSSRPSPGEIIECSIDDFAPTSHLCAAHQIDLPTALQLGRQLGQQMPEAVTIIGVQVADDRTIAEQCTPAVEQAIEPAAQLALTTAREQRSAG